MSKNLRKIWTQLGVGFDETFSKKAVIDLEKTILETSVAGRQDSRLLFGLRGWLLKHHDLVNGSRLIRLVKQAEMTAVLGAVIDSVIKEEPRSALVSVLRYCKKLSQPEFLFHRIAASKVEANINRKECLEIWKRWNLISNELSSMEGAVSEKQHVLKHNPNLALRALFGAGTRAEVFGYFLQHTEGNAMEICKALNQSYQPVYSELTAICKIGLAKVKKVGAAKVFHVSSHFIEMLLKLLSTSQYKIP